MVFDTPERRAELEKTLRELTARIRDESVRFHYQQDMRERVQAFFGAPNAEPRRAGAQDERGRGHRAAGGPVRRPGASPCRKAWRGRRWSSAPAA